ncbi:MAG TPA: VWA domain-containing protein [Candidatus Acidoferrales bacterium]|nr:VWA domain-containing protein [Candidatus Acidoferrales bacterium]
MPILSFRKAFHHKFRARIPSSRGTRLGNATAFGTCGAVLALFAASSLKPLAARDTNQQDERGRIRSEVTLVSVLASVLDKQGRPALGLTADQFEIYEEGVKQRIDVLESETQQPLDLALMIDSSLSELKELEFEEDAASRFIQKLVRPADRLAVYEFADAVTQLAPFSSNVPSLQAALRRITPGDGTALYDAIYLSSQGLSRNPAGRRRVIVLVTDAGETTSRADFETARRAALRADALLYTIVVRAVKNEGGRNTAGEHALDTIADSTGGATYFPDTIAQLGDMFDLIDRELRTQYRLAYYPDPRPPAGTFRALEVRAKCECTVRSRKAYYSGGRLD